MAGELQSHGHMAAARKNDDDSDGAIHKMDTLPPPEGEDDAYNAATKVGPMARAAVEAMMAKAQVDENSSLPPPASFTRGVKVPKPGRLPTMDATPREPEIEKIYDEIQDGDLFEPTALLAVAEAPPAASMASAAPAVAVQSVVPPATATPDVPPTPSIAPARPSTLVAEIAIFVGTFVALSLVALVVYLAWLR